MSIFRALLSFGLAAAMGAPAPVAAQVARVENTAHLTYRAAATAPEQTIASNTVAFDVAASKRPTVLSFHLLPLGYTLGGFKCSRDASVPAPIDAATLAAAPRIAALDVTAPIIVELDNPGGNHDPAVRERSTIHVRSGANSADIPLLETAPDSGVFAGGFPGIYSPGAEACAALLTRGVPLEVGFTEDAYSYASSASQLVDPAGYVFASADGTLVDGATVTLLDASGQPATVFGDDGVSRYPATMISGAAVTDASGRAYPAVHGRYRFPLAAPGSYTIKVAPPSPYRAPSTVPPDKLATLPGPNGGAFIINDASYGRPLTLMEKAPFNADLPLDVADATPGGGAARADLLLTKSASVRDASPGDAIQYRLTVENKGVTVGRALHITDTLPAGLRFRLGSTRGGPAPVVSADGRVLDFALAPLAGGATAELSYLITIAPGASVGEIVNRARVLDAIGPVSNEASASVRVHPLLFSDAMTVIGRVTEGRCGDPADHRAGIPGVRLLLEDGTFTVTDRDGLYHFEGVRPGRHVVQMDTVGLPASYAPVACDADTRQAGSAISRFVEGGGGVLARVDFQLAPTGKSAVANAALPIEVADDASAAGRRDWLVGQTPGIGWLFPAIDHNPRAPALRVVVKHHPGQRVALTLNGATPEALAFDGSDTAGEVAVSRWTALPLSPGDNHLAARVLNADGSVAATLERTVHYAGAATRATFDQQHSRLSADGLTRPLLAVRVTDATGHPVRAGTLVPFRVDAPYAAAVEADLAQARQVAGRDRAETEARVVGDDGYAFLALQPTTQAGAVHAVVSLAEDRQVRTSEVRAWLAGAARDWVVVGFGAGTLGYDVLHRHGQPLPGDARSPATLGGQLAFYAKGRIKGSWLLTIAYDSNRRRDPDRGLLGTIDPDRYYTVYGDGSVQGYDAPTQRKLYVRVERPRAYALYGDLETGMTDTQLTRYSRTLNGIKAAYEGNRLRAVGVAAKPDTRYARDEIQGNGLSGPYRLSQHGIVPNSDKLRIEVRDRFRSERILSSRDLTRHIDYDIDPIAGTVRFREPVLSRDLSLNPTFIVVDYEVEGNAGKLVAAARVAARTANGAVEVGAAAIRDESVGPDATVVGADLKVRVDARTVVRAEAASGGHDGPGHGRAYLAEVEHHGAGVDVLAYARQQDAAFGVGQQNLVEAGTRKLGVDAKLQITDRLSLTTTAWRQEQLDGPGTRIAGEARLQYRQAAGTVYLGTQIADDQGLDGQNRDSRLLTVGATRTLLDGRLDLTGEAQVAPGGARSSVDFPARQRLTAAFRVLPGIRLIGGYEIADGQDFTTHTAQLGFDLSPWTGAKLSSTLNQQAIGENGQRTYAQYGLAQSLPLGRHWTIDATLDASNTIGGSLPAQGVVTAFQPVASGGFLGQDQRDGDYAAVTLGAAWRRARWSWNGRVEYRDATAADRFGVTSNLLRTLGAGETLASSLRLYQVRAAGGAISRSFAADLALALRPLDSRWSLLERLAWRHERADAGVAAADVLDAALTTGVAQVTTRVVNNLALDYRTGPEGSGHGFEATFYYGAKQVTGKLTDDTYDGFIDVTGFELRRDLGHRLDLGVQGSVQHAWTDGAWTWSGGPSVGVSPGSNLWLTLGYNVAGYRDRDFAADRYTRAGPYLTLRLKVDQRSLGALAGHRR